MQFVVEQGNHAQARRKGKTTTNKKNSGSLTPPSRRGRGEGGTSLPIRVGAAGYGMMYDGLWPLCPDRYILGAFHLGKKPGNFGGSKSGISDW